MKSNQEQMQVQATKLWGLYGASSKKKNMRKIGSSNKRIWGLYGGSSNKTVDI